MTGEIKFRAWHKVLKIYIIVDAIDFSGGTIRKGDPCIIEDRQNGGCYLLDNCILEQYTGYKTSDKGVKIFAGDKVEFSGYGLEPNISGIVEFKKGAWYVGEHHELYYGVENYLVEIIGNIHDNEETE